MVALQGLAACHRVLIGGVTGHAIVLSCFLVMFKLCLRNQPM